jgi:hypothetical protein
VALSAWVLTALPALLVAVMTAVLTPLALAVAGVPRWLRLAAWPAGVLAAIGLVVVEEPGTAAVLTVVPYACVAVAAGAIGGLRLVARHGPASRIALSVGLVFLPAATLWLVSARAGYPLLGYEPFWVLLTAAHFHVAGMYLLVVLGRVTFERGRLAAAIAIACVLSVPLTAAGIYGPRWLEVAAAVGMAASAFGGGVLLLLAPRLALRIAGAVLLISMPLAGAFALRDHGTTFSVFGLDPLGSMLVSHGALNTLVFALIALVALARTPPPAILVGAPPLSHLGGGFTIGPTFLASRGLERESTSGLFDQLADLAHAGLDPAQVAPAIRAFYERTADHEMIVTPRWRAGFRTGGRLWARIARRLGQLQLPVRVTDDREGITSRVVAVDADADGRHAPRSWIRTFPDGRALYVAVYSTHEADARRYMNIAFPLPGGNLTSILRMDARGRGVRVSTRVGGDAGIWLVLGGVAIRTPMSEELDVWTADDPDLPPELRTWAEGYTTVAIHKLWLFGVHFLTLHYAMRLRA